MSLPRTFALLALVLLAIVTLSLIATDEVEAVDYDIDLYYKDDTNIKPARGLNPIVFNYSVEDTGDELNQEVHAQFYNVSPQWRIIVAVSTITDVYLSTYDPARPTEFLLQRGEIADMVVTVTPPPNQLAGIYWMKVDVWPKKNATNNESHDFAVIISQVAGVEIKLWGPSPLPPNNTFTAFPHYSLTIQFAVYNRGNGVDNFLFQGSSSRADEGWMLTFSKGVDQYGFTPNITANTPESNPHIVEVKVLIPTGVRAGLTSQIIINATSRFNELVQSPPITASVASSQFALFQVYFIGANMKEGVPGGEVEFQLRIYNQGNGWDKFTIMPIWDTNLNPGFVASANPGTIEIDAIDNGTVKYIVKVPEMPSRKTYFFTAEIASSFMELSPVTKSFEVGVGQHYALKLEAEDSHRTTIPGSSLEFSVTVMNTGNGLDSIVIDNITNLPSKWLAYIKPLEATFLQDQKAVFYIIVIVPSHIEDAPIGLYNLTVSAHSLKSDAMAETYLEIEITQFHRIEWMKEGGSSISPVDVVPIDGGTVRVNPFTKEPTSISFDIFNFGNAWDAVTIGATSDNERATISVDPELVLLPSMSGVTITLSISVPQDEPTEAFNVWLTADSQDPTVGQRVVGVYVKVVHVDVSLPPTMTHLPPVGSPVVVDRVQLRSGEEVSFMFNVTNNGTATISNVLIRGWDRYGEEGAERSEAIFEYTIPYIRVGDEFTIGGGDPEGAPFISWRSDVTGVHTLVFEAVYPHQSDTGNDISSVMVVVNGLPEVKVDDTEIVVTEGDELVVTGTVEDIIGDIEWVKVRVDGGNWAEANGTTMWSVEIDTKGLDPGQHKLEVVASDGRTESLVLETTFEVEERFKVDETLAIGLVVVLLVLIAAAIVLRRRRS